LIKRVLVVSGGGPALKPCPRSGARSSVALAVADLNPMYLSPNFEWHVGDWDLRGTWYDEILDSFKKRYSSA
jgi:hypothetical protein